MFVCTSRGPGRRYRHAESGVHPGAVKNDELFIDRIFLKSYRRSFKFRLDKIRVCLRFHIVM